MARLPRYVAQGARVPALARLAPKARNPGLTPGAGQFSGWNVSNAVLRICEHSAASHWSAAQLIMIA